MCLNEKGKVYVADVQQPTGSEFSIDMLITVVKEKAQKKRFLMCRDIRLKLPFLKDDNLFNEFMKIISMMEGVKIVKAIFLDVMSEDEITEMKGRLADFSFSSASAAKMSDFEYIGFSDEALERMANRSPPEEKLSTRIVVHLGSAIIIDDDIIE